MKKLTKDQFEEATTRKQTNISIELDKLKVGEALTVMKYVWDRMKLKSVFHAYIYNLGRPKKFKIRALKSGAGWSVLRIK